ncbi:YhcN/YlaJ family sporulation lipoprotein [Bacillus sp. MRMR6]|uniref:YhcN/YlaJ family sporulation lipoprotein n=1 Tax=Bacillus sp. MRMR6 TaxID=1928617 RepID=UPI000951C804|nr:YhcN/YlaJ family sporulation lipoprotein [Bacillus sp. MRMR6]OLS36766.1 hypothetical protein BTR25_17275 [Bacillus sp. MRMR6]
MKKSWTILSSAAVLSLCLAGCGGDNQAGGQNRENGNNNTIGQNVRNNQVGTRNVNNNRNAMNDRTLRVADQAEQQVEKMAEVDEAHVIIANNNAYVAVRMANNNNNNNNANNNNANTNPTNTNTAGNNGFVNQDGRSGTIQDGMIDGQGDAGTNRRNTGMGTNGNNARNNNNNNNFIGTERTNRNNGTQGNNEVGTAPRTVHYTEVSNAFGQKIADQVRQADNKIHKVYISVNPDLYTRMNTYAEDIRTDRNRPGLFEDFTNTVNDFFGR